MKNKELTRCFIEGSKSANSKDFILFYNYMYGYMREVHIKNPIFTIKGEELFEDLFQDCMMKILKARDNYNPEKSAIKTYFSWIFKNNLVDYIRRDKKIEFVSLEGLEEPLYN